MMSKMRWPKGLPKYEALPREEVIALRAVADAARFTRDWYGLPLIYRQEHGALCAALDVLDKEKGDE